MSYRLEIGLALLLASAVGVAVFAAHRTPKPQERDFRASTFLSGPDDSVAVGPPLDVGPQQAAPLRLPRAARVFAPRPRGGRLEGLVKRGVAAIAEPCDSLVVERSDTLVAAIDGRPVVLRQNYAGGGTITLASDVGWFRNQVWRDSDVPYVIMPLLTPPLPRAERRGRVVW